MATDFPWHLRLLFQPQRCVVGEICSRIGRRSCVLNKDLTWWPANGSKKFPNTHSADHQCTRFAEVQIVVLSTNITSLKELKGTSSEWKLLGLFQMVVHSCTFSTKRSRVFETLSCCDQQLDETSTLQRSCGFYKGYCAGHPFGHNSKGQPVRVEGKYQKSIQEWWNTRQLHFLWGERMWVGPGAIRKVWSRSEPVCSMST